MDKYGFQGELYQHLPQIHLAHQSLGADLDWEYPVDATRGGNRADTANFALLVKEMRAAFGTKYGISVALAPDYWYLRYVEALAA